MSLLLMACRGGAYVAAKRADTIVGWREFLAANPSDPDADAAKGRLETLEFDEAKAAHSVVGYKRHVERYPDGATTSQARARLEGLRLSAAQAQDTLAAWRQFLRDHPDGAHAAQARTRVEALAAGEALNTDDPTTWASLAAAHPDDRTGAHAKARLEALAFSRASSALSRFAYLRDFPAGPNRDAVKAALLRVELEGLLVSGALAEADRLAAKAPLVASLTEWPARRAEAAGWASLLAAKDARAREAHFRFGLPSTTDLARVLVSADDPLTRCDAASALAEHVSVLGIDALLKAVVESRLTKVRLQAFAALRALLRSLPSAVAEFEMARRLDAASGGLVQAVLHDLLGQLDRAGAAYERSVEGAATDPLVLTRALEVKLERGQGFGSAIAARQLTIWANEQMQPDAIALTSSNRVWAARELCAVSELSERAHQALLSVGPKSEFPADVEAFALKAAETVALARAKLRDAELALLSQDRQARLCGDDSAARAGAESERRRLKALGQPKTSDSAELRLARFVAAALDPSPAVRAAADQRLGQ